MDIDAISHYHDYKRSIAKILNVKTRALQIMEIKLGCVKFVFLCQKIYNTLIPLSQILNAALANMDPPIKRMTTFHKSRLESIKIRDTSCYVLPGSTL